MSEIAPKQKTTNNSLYHDKDISFKWMVFFYKFANFVLGLNLGFIEFKVFGFNCFKFVTFIQCTVFSFFTISSLYLIRARETYLLWFSLIFIQYLSYVLILMRIKKETTTYNLIQNLRAIDSGLNVNQSSDYLEIKLLVCMLTCFAYRLWMSTTYFSKLEEVQDYPLIISLNASLYVITHLGIDIVRVTYAFMFCAINCRMRNLKLLLKTKQTGFLSMQYLYRSIVDIAEQHKEAFDPVLISSLMFNVPQAMIITLTMIQIIRDTRMFKGSDSVLCIIDCELLLLTILPAICAGSLASQAKQIKVILHEILLKQQEDSMLCRELERFIRYVDARGCRFRVCKLIPLDASLLGMVVSFCVTYLIVVIQFTFK